jgi:hypothetical protein
MRRSAIEDTTFIGPIDLLLRQGTLYVLDRGGNRVLALESATGVSKWSVGGPGSGPAEFQELMSFTTTEAGEVAALDVGNRRVTVLTGDGRIRFTEPLTPDALVYSECHLRGGLRVGAIFDRENGFVITGPEGAIRARFATPWADLQDADPLLHQVVLTSAESVCVAGGVRGGGLAVFDSTGPTRSGRYVETIALPEVIQTERSATVSSAIDAARDVKVLGDTIFVLFGGASELRGRVVDLYELSGLRYVSTRVLPGSAVSLAVAQGGILYVLANRRGVFEIAGLRFRPT